MCGAVKERSLQRAPGGGALSLHLPSPLPDLQDTPQDADRGTVTAVMKYYMLLGKIMRNVVYILNKTGLF